MTKDEIIKMARQAGFVCLMPDEAMDMIGGIFEGDANLLGNFEAFAKLVAKVEREACALLVEANADACMSDGVTQMCLYSNAKAILARGEE